MCALASTQMFKTQRFKFEKNGKKKKKKELIYIINCCYTTFHFQEKNYS